MKLVFAVHLLGTNKSEMICPLFLSQPVLIAHIHLNISAFDNRCTGVYGYRHLCIYLDGVTIHVDNLSTSFKCSKHPGVVV